MASTASSTVPCPVSTTTGSAGAIPWTRAERLDAVHPGQLVVDQHGVGLETLQLRQPALRRVRQDRIEAGAFEIDAQVLPQRRLVLDDEYRSGRCHQALPVAGSRSATVVPCPGELRTSIAPPKRSTIRFASGSPTPSPFGFVV